MTNPQSPKPNETTMWVLFATILVLILAIPFFAHNQYEQGYTQGSNDAATIVCAKFFLAEGANLSYAESSCYVTNQRLVQEYLVNQSNDN